MFFKKIYTSIFLRNLNHKKDLMQNGKEFPFQQTLSCFLFIISFTEQIQRSIISFTEMRQRSQLTKQVIDFVTCPIINLHGY